MDRIRALFPPGTLPVARERASIEDLRRRLGSLQVAWVRLEGERNSYIWVPKRELNFKNGDPFTLEALGRGLRRLYCTNHYESLWPYLTLTDEGKVGITLELVERDPTYASVGLLYDNSHKANLDVQVERDNLMHVGETLHFSAFLGNFYDGLETGLRSNRLRGVPLGLDLLLRADRRRYGQPGGREFRRSVRLLQAGTSLSGSQNTALLFGARLFRDRGEQGAGVPEWNDLFHTLYGVLLMDRTDHSVMPSRGQRFRFSDEIYLGEGEGQTIHQLDASALAAISAWRFSLIPEVRLAGVSLDGAKFRYWSRLDLTRQTWGEFRPSFYSPWMSRMKGTLAFRIVPNLSFWVEGSAGFQAARFDLLRAAPARKGLQWGFLQRTPIGPVMAGSAYEKEHPPFTFIQVGFDLGRD